MKDQVRLELPSQESVPEFETLEQALGIWGEEGVIEALNRYLDQQRANRKYRAKRNQDMKVALAYAKEHGLV